MATRSNIALEKIDGSLDVIYCHYDGYFEYNGKILSEHYNDLESVKRLIELGDIRSLQPEIDKIEPFEVEADHYRNLNAYYNVFRPFTDIEFVYIFSEKTSTWRMMTIEQFHRFAKAW